MTSYLQQRTLYPPLIQNKPSLNLGIIVVIPAYDEANLLFSLMALKKCSLPSCDVEVLVVVNDSESDPVEVKYRNDSVAQKAREWALQQNDSRLKFHILRHSGLPKMHAGVGLARKIGMDEACWRFEKAGNQHGIIACFDADSRCDSNYFLALADHFDSFPETQACSIYFEHPLESIDFEDSIYEAIILYELHLRYYIQALRYAGFPFATHAIGSAMAVRSDAYQRQGGMNKRKAGEDFYFLHKFTPLGHFSEIKTTRVMPSPRPSHRVPFGTGKAIVEIMKSKAKFLTYHPQSFEDLKPFFQTIDSLFFVEKENLPSFLFKLPKSIQAFLSDNQFEEKVSEIQANTAGPDTFQNRFFRWFNAFMVMKYLHFARDSFYENSPVEEAAGWLLKKYSSKNFGQENLSARQLLVQFRKMDKK